MNNPEIKPPTENRVTPEEKAFISFLTVMAIICINIGTGYIFGAGWGWLLMGGFCIWILLANLDKIKGDRS